MLTTRRKELLLWGILALLMAAIITLPAQASDYGTKDLVLGSQGAAVTQLQKDLNELGFYSYRIDGNFGPKTLDAVKNFQKSQGLKIDGVVGPITKAALSDALKQASNGTGDLALGSQGTAVTQLQKDLNELGFYSYRIDGNFAQKTHEAVVSFQKSRGLKADGVVGPITRAALDDALTGNEYSPPVAPSATVPTAASISHYNSHEKPVVDAFRASFDGSLAQTLVGRAIWYMEYGYMKYGHTKYATTGYIDCSNFVSLVYKDFGYSITSAAKNYGSVGVKVEGVYSEKIPGTSKYTLLGVDRLKPGDIFTFWNSDAPARTHIGHVALYMGVINGKPCIINTCSGNPTAIGIINNFSYWYGSELIEVRRVLPESAFVAGNKITDNGPVIPAIYQIRPDKPIVMPKNLSTGF
ncbi:MAG: peptidoglycan-binding protein [Syntrophomonadaceae bacterium]|jgi:peptidoglycan hydrolase-like protein with peptidoglycan-binding domain